MVKKYEKDELIPCKSITNGKLLVTGARSNILYKWADYGHVIDVEFQDLDYMIRSHKSEIMKPRFIILDEELVNKYPDIRKLYDTLYSMDDLKDIIDLPVSAMRKAIANLPSGAKIAVRDIAGSMIDDGSLDSVSKIKALDELFGTNLLLTLANR